jgi:hypothetical protein
LDLQRQAVRQLVKNTGVVFAALNERKGQLRQLIVNSQRTFSATAARDVALAETFRVFPTFLDESRITANRLERFAVDTHPLINELKPVADNLGPTIQDVSALSPDLTRFFIHLKPVIRAAPRTLPEAARFLRGARPALEALHPFLQEFNPILSYLNYQSSITAGFLSTAGAALNYRIGGVPNTHALPQLGIIVPDKSLSINSNSVPDWVRGSAYMAPNARDRAIPLGTIESMSCANAGGTRRNPSNTSSNPQAPCFQQPPSLYDGDLFPTVDRGEVSKKPTPSLTLRGRWPANPNTHP